MRESFEERVPLRCIKPSVLRGCLELLAGLLRHNDSVRELDLTASDLGKEGAAALARALPANKGLTTVRLGFNPDLDDEAKAALRAAAASRSAPLTLEL